MCHAKVKYSGNTANLRAQLTEQQTANIKQVDFSKLTLEQQVHTLRLPTTSTRATKTTQSILYFICKDMHPLSVVKNEGFCNMLNTTEPRYTIPSLQHITEIAVLMLYKEVKTRVLCALTSSAHHITDEWKLDSYVLQRRVTHDTHTGENIARLLKEAVTEWRLEVKDPVIITQLDLQT